MDDSAKWVGYSYWQSAKYSSVLTKSVWNVHASRLKKTIAFFGHATRTGSHSWNTINAI